MKKLYAWGWKASKDTINEYRDKISPELGIIHYPGTYSAARPGDIAYVSNASHAQSVVSMKDIFVHAILADERNIDGPSGKYETPEEYNDRLREAYEILEAAGISNSAKGLAMVPENKTSIVGFLGFGINYFDDEYLDRITIGRHRGVNSHTIHYNRMIDGLERHAEHKFFITMIPWRWRWDFTVGYLRQVFTRPSVKNQLRELFENEQVIGVGVWGLHEGKMSNGQWQSFHGLLDRNTRLTWQGRMIKELLEEKDGIN